MTRLPAARSRVKTLAARVPAELVDPVVADTVAVAALTVTPLTPAVVSWVSNVVFMAELLSRAVSELVFWAAVGVAVTEYAKLTVKVVSMRFSAS